jgi:beta-carotene hydroxylase
MIEATLKQEIEIANRHRPKVAVPTLCLLAGVYSGLAASCYFALNGQLPMWLAAVINGIFLYGTYTVVHEAVHNNIVSAKSRFKWMNWRPGSWRPFHCGY